MGDVGGERRDRSRGVDAADAAATSKRSSLTRIEWRPRRLRGREQTADAIAGTRRCSRRTGLEDDIGRSWANLASRSEILGLATRSSRRPVQRRGTGQRRRSRDQRRCAVFDVRDGPERIGSDLLGARGGPRSRRAVGVAALDENSATGRAGQLDSVEGARAYRNSNAERRRLSFPTCGDATPGHRVAERPAGAARGSSVRSAVAVRAPPRGERRRASRRRWRPTTAGTSRLRGPGVSVDVALTAVCSSKGASFIRIDCRTIRDRPESGRPWSMTSSRRRSRDTAWAMSEENVETDASVAGRLRTRRQGRLDALVHPDVEVVPIGASAGRTHPGTRGGVGLLARPRGAMGAGSYELDEVVDGGDRSAARMRRELRGKSSGVEVEYDYWVVFTFATGCSLGLSGSRIGRKPSKPPGCRSSALDEKRDFGADTGLPSVRPEDLTRARRRRANCCACTGIRWSTKAAVTEPLRAVTENACTSSTHMLRRSAPFASRAVCCECSEPVVRVVLRAPLEGDDPGVLNDPVADLNRAADRLLPPPGLGPLA